MFSFAQVPDAARLFAAGAGKAAIRAAGRFAKEAPRHVSSAQSYAMSVARTIGAETPKHLETARAYVGEAASVVMTQAPKHAHAAQHLAGEAAQVVVKRAPGHVGAAGQFAGGMAKTVVAEAPRRFEQARAFAADAAKSVVTGAPKSWSAARSSVVGMAKRVGSRQYGKALAGGASTVSRRVSYVATESSRAAAAVGVGLWAMAVPSTITTPFMTASGRLGNGAGDAAAGHATDGTQRSNGEIAADGANGSASTSSVDRSAVAGGFGLAIVKGVAQIVGGAAAVAGGLFGLAGHVFGGQEPGSNKAPDGEDGEDGEDEHGKQKRR